MLRFTLRDLVARKIRLLLSCLAIVLGVAFVAGSFIFTDSMGGAFDDIIEGSTADVEIAYEGANDFDSVQDSRTIPGAVVDELRALPEVGSVHPQMVLQTVFVVGSGGKVVGGNGPPGLGMNPTGAVALTGNPVLELTDGALPDAAYEVALDVDTAEKAGYGIGDRFDLVTPGRPPTIEVELTGLVEFGSGSGLNGATLTILDTEFMQQQFYAGRDVYSSISLNAADDVSQSQLRDAAGEVLPRDVIARAGDDYVEENQASLEEILGFLQTFLLVFAGVSLVVGVFMIINTFSILLAQRSRELALLRTLGASRRQLTGSVVLEAVVVGLLGSALGLGAGYLLARGLGFVFGLLGLDLSRASFVVEPATVVWSFVVGVLVTVVAAYLPARRASRIPPIQALRDEVALPETTLRRRLLIGSGLVVLGVGSVAGGFTRPGDSGLPLIGLGMLLVLIGAALLSPLAARPVIRLFGPGYRRGFGTVGRLATQNSLRNPRRTAATASALMVGLALVAMTSVLARSAAESVDEAVEADVTSQFIVSNVVGQPFSTDVAAQIRQVEGVRSVASIRSALADLNGSFVFPAAVNPRDFVETVDLPFIAGGLAGLEAGTVILDSTVASDLDVAVGDRVELELQGGTEQLTVVGVFAATGALPADVVVTFDTFEKGGIAPLDSMVFVAQEPGADAGAVRAALEDVTADLPTVTVKDPAGFAAEQREQIDIFLNLIYGLLGLSLVIAILGIVNTFGLSVIERTREIGLLRAIGTSRRQLRTMIRLESGVVAIFGALLGVALGLAFGTGLVIALEDEGLTELSVPWLRMAVFVLAAGVVGVLAGALPARRAARLDVLRAIATE